MSKRPYLERAHTPEPWKVADDDTLPIILDTSNRDIGFELTLKNAERIVACVNACAGIPTAVLEAGAMAELRSASQAVADAWEARDGLIRSVGEAMKPLRAVLARLDGEEGAS